MWWVPRCTPPRPGPFWWGGAYQHERRQRLGHGRLATRHLRSRLPPVAAHRLCTARRGARHARRARRAGGTGVGATARAPALLLHDPEVEGPPQRPPGGGCGLGSGLRASGFGLRAKAALRFGLRRGLRRG
eukprot:scaffold32195_cov65-Phaeocystis_antarctica.AAC.1